MDAGLTGGLIGFGIIVCAGMSLKFYDVLQKRKQRRRLTHQTPLLIHPRPVLLVRRQSKMNMLLPK